MQNNNSENELISDTEPSPPKISYKDSELLQALKDYKVEPS